MLVIITYRIDNDTNDKQFVFDLLTNVDDDFLTFYPMESDSLVRTIAYEAVASSLDEATISWKGGEREIRTDNLKYVHGVIDEIFNRAMIKDDSLSRWLKVLLY